MRGGDDADDAKASFLVLSQGKLICSVIVEASKVGKDPVYILFTTTDKTEIEKIMRKIAEKISDESVTKLSSFSSEHSAPRYVVPSIKFTSGAMSRDLLMSVVTRRTGNDAHFDDRRLSSFFEKNQLPIQLPINDDLKSQNGTELIDRLRKIFTELGYTIDDIGKQEYTTNHQLRSYWALERIAGKEISIAKVAETNFRNQFIPKFKTLATNIGCILALYGNTAMSSVAEKVAATQQPGLKLEDIIRILKDDHKPDHWTSHYINILTHIRKLKIEEILQAITEYETKYSEFDEKQKNAIRALVESMAKSNSFIRDDNTGIFTIRQYIIPVGNLWDSMKTFFEQLAENEKSAASVAAPVAEPVVAAPVVADTSTVVAEPGVAASVAEPVVADTSTGVAASVAEPVVAEPVIADTSIGKNGGRRRTKRKGRV
jgi:hypothetical protein